ncbi:hypothetical protein [Cupriavidus campinensis]|uniref:DNA transfer protein n=1 Tax=Cupriavidus campinensis TaxID=151783 RepID=A0ABY3EKW9_9BURK|nr:hypothetical protein [Cupriavidus campinensis]TSP11433.1 hypothetical protein FGG12_17500 [Cupriavidus campinensis]
MAGLDFLLGAQGDDANAARMGLLSAGLGILANNTGHYGAAGPALASGAMTGLQGYQGALDQQAQNRVNAFKLQQQQAALEAAQRQQAYRQSIASGQEKFDPNRALAAGIPIEEIRAIGEFPNIGKAEIKEYKEIRGPDGAVTLVGYDKFGNAVNTGATPFKAPTYQDLGGQVVGIDPITGKQVTVFGKSMTPGEIASNAVARANLGISQQRLALDKQNAGGFANNPMIKGAPSGYRWNAKGELESIPGGPAEVGKAPTEFQGKSAVFGARATEADRILSDLQGKYSPVGIGAKNSASNVPVVGGLLGAGANTMLSPETQMAEQAQRDFVNAMLRQESGASIAPSEFDNARKQYFPQPGDSDKVIAQKARNREIAIQGLQNNAGKAAYKPAPASGGGWSAKRID